MENIKFAVATVALLSFCCLQNTIAQSCASENTSKLEDTASADGATNYHIQTRDLADATCCSEFGPIISPLRIAPDCGVFLTNN